MANTGRRTMCPYYISDSNETISCEDTIHKFGTKGKRRHHNSVYCDTEFWKNCPYAQAMEKLYENLPRDIKDAEIMLLEHKLASTRKELKKLLTMMGMQKGSKHDD